MGATRNTGYLENLIQYDASDNVAIATSVNASYKVTLGGNLLGTTAVFDAGASEGAIRIERDTVGTNTVIGALNFTNNNGTTVYGRVRGGRNTAGDGYVSLGTGISDTLFANETGRVGIGTASPSDKLTVTDASTYTFNIGAASGGAGAVLYTLGSAALTFATNGSANERMRITSGGNVLINTTSDTGYKLQVNGVSQFRDTSVVTKVVGSSYSQTSTSGSTSIVNTGIFYNTSIVGFGNMSSYLVTVRGNPNASGSGSYAAVIIGYITIVTGYDFGISSVIQQISWTEIVNKQPPNIASISVSVVFWNGTTESTQQTDGNTSNQIRIKVSGYNTSFVGSNQDIRITKVTD